jgi:DNA-binding transcriptional ArsR family regulator
MTTTEGGGAAFAWDALVPLLVHPSKVAIIEALLSLERPMSGSQLKKLFGSDCGLKSIPHHVLALRDAGVLEVVDERPVRGAREYFYYFKSQR